MGSQRVNRSRHTYFARLNASSCGPPLPTATPTGQYLGCVPLQRLLREPPSMLVGGIVDADLPWLEPDTSLPALTRYFAAYNLVCGPVLDAQHHLLGAVSVDDVLDHLLPHDWRATNDEPALDAALGQR